MSVSCVVGPVGRTLLPLKERVYLSVLHKLSPFASFDATKLNLSACKLGRHVLFVLTRFCLRFSLGHLTIGPGRKQTGQPAARLG